MLRASLPVDMGYEFGQASEPPRELLKPLLSIMTSMVALLVLFQLDWRTNAGSPAGKDAPLEPEEAGYPVLGRLQHAILGLRDGEQETWLVSNVGTR